MAAIPSVIVVCIVTCLLLKADPALAALAVPGVAVAGVLWTAALATEALTRSLVT